METHNLYPKYYPHAITIQVNLMQQKLTNMCRVVIDYSHNIHFTAKKTNMFSKELKVLSF